MTPTQFDFLSHVSRARYRFYQIRLSVRHNLVLYLN